MEGKEEHAPGPRDSHDWPPLDPELRRDDDALRDRPNGDRPDVLAELRGGGQLDSTGRFTKDLSMERRRALEVMEYRNVAELLLESEGGNWAPILGYLRPFLASLDQALNPKGNRSIREQHRLLVERHPNVVEEIKRWLPLLENLVARLRRRLDSGAPERFFLLPIYAFVTLPQHISRGLLLAAATERFRELLHPPDEAADDESPRSWIKDILKTNVLDLSQIHESWHTTVDHLPWKRAKARLPQEYVAEVARRASNIGLQAQLLEFVIYHPELDRFDGRIEGLPDIQPLQISTDAQAVDEAFEELRGSSRLSLTEPVIQVLTSRVENGDESHSQRVRIIALTEEQLRTLGLAVDSADSERWPLSDLEKTAVHAQRLEFLQASHVPECLLRLATADQRSIYAIITPSIRRQSGETYRAYMFVLTKGYPDRFSAAEAPWTVEYHHVAEREVIVPRIHKLSHLGVRFLFRVPERKESTEGIDRIVAKEQEALEQFFGYPFDLEQFRRTLERYGKEKIEAWAKLGLEPHFLPARTLTKDTELPGWTVRPNAWYWEQLGSGQLLLPNEQGKLEVVAEARLPGKTLLVDTRCKPEYDRGVQMWADDEDFCGSIVAQLRKQGRLKRREGIPDSSRFGVTAAEWEKHVRPAVAKHLGLRTDQVMSETALAANLIPQIHTGMARAKDGTTTTWVWYKERFKSAARRLDGGHSDYGGLANVNYNHATYWRHSLAFRPLGVLD